MAFAASARNARPIEGAVATLGVSDRVTFLRKTYAHLGVALIAWAVLTGALFHTTFSLRFSAWALGGRGTWLAVIFMFMAVGWIAERLARSQTSAALQYAGLGIMIFAEALLLQPIIWLIFYQFAHGGLTASPMTIVTEAAVITGVIFVGLTLTVFISKKDFSFLRGALSIATFAALGIIVASLLFGFQLGAIFCGAMVLLMAGYVLFQTSLMMKYFPPTAYVAASLMLFSTVATLFWYVLQLVLEMNRR
jgi:uncharacterized protein